MRSELTAELDTTRYTNKSSPETGFESRGGERRVGVHEAEQLISRSGIHELVDSRQWEVVFRACFVEEFVNLSFDDSDSLRREVASLLLHWLAGKVDVESVTDDVRVDQACLTATMRICLCYSGGRW
ncbi:hypothetical protein L3X38_032461 [Prunus dulcis]|uniref:Uncharacterized protein n=1 Tax=Prunus dulcis TaxID=3755 RepID=A0AAD4VFI0_PRUDU|nr:hypothetical protein L3X38_032461 [Prunus dulcis]